ncbi:MAG: hypothetical protein E4H14_08375 [Candidatus Thorarchaeota archaeon]|nr:MAG: hypothetical protein E4H14_08375 [Candidatus Thorarchaeota archaeon]
MNTGTTGHLEDGPLCGINEIVTVAIVDGNVVSGEEYYLHLAAKARALSNPSDDIFEKCYDNSHWTMDV